MDVFVSIVVPARNDERSIERCLYGIARQTYPRERLEVIVVDGQSQDMTRAVVTRFAHESTLDVRLIGNPARTAAAALNAGLRDARGDLVMALDAHATLAPDYVRRCVDALETSHAECATGAVTYAGDSYVSRGIAVALASRLGVGGAGAGETAAALYRREVFDYLGGFTADIEAAAVADFNARIRNAGGQVLALADARATYTVHEGLAALWRRAFAHGRATPDVMSRHPRGARMRQFVPGSAIAMAALSVPAALEGRSGTLKLLTGGYALFNLAASLAAGVRRLASLPVLPVAFAVMHVAYAAGFLSGTSRMMLRGLLQRDIAGRDTEELEV